MLSSRDNCAQNAFDQILVKLSKRTPSSPKNGHFYMTMRQLNKKHQSKLRHKFQSRSVSLKQNPDQKRKMQNQSQSVQQKMNPQNLYNSTFVTIKNARYHLGETKNYQIKNLQFPNFGRKSPNKKKLKPLVQEQFMLSKNFSTNRSKIMDASQVKMSWNRYMNITGFRRSNTPKGQINQDEQQYVRNFMGKNKQVSSRAYQIKLRNKRDKSQQGIEGWNIAYPEEWVVPHKNL